MAQGPAVSTGGRPEGGGREGSRLPPSAPKLRGITLELSPRQVRSVLREATGADGLRELLTEHMDDLGTAVADALANPAVDPHRISYSALRALGVLCAFAPRGSLRGVKEVGEELGMSQSTAHRYARTFTAIGLLEQGEGRKYRLPLPAQGVDTGRV